MYQVIKTKCIYMQERDKYNYRLILWFEESTEREEIYILPCNMKDKNWIVCFGLEIRKLEVWGGVQEQADAVCVPKKITR